MRSSWKVSIERRHRPQRGRLLLGEDAHAELEGARAHPHRLLRRRGRQRQRQHLVGAAKVHLDGRHPGPVGVGQAVGSHLGNGRLGVQRHVANEARRVHPGGNAQRALGRHPNGRHGGLGQVVREHLRFVLPQGAKHEGRLRAAVARPLGRDRGRPGAALDPEGRRGGGRPEEQRLRQLAQGGDDLVLALGADGWIGTLVVDVFDDDAALPAERLRLAVEVGLEHERGRPDALPKMVVGHPVVHARPHASRRAQPGEGEIVGHDNGRLAGANGRVEEGRAFRIEHQRERGAGPAEQRWGRHAEDPLDQPRGIHAESRQPDRPFAEQHRDQVDGAAEALGQRALGLAQAVLVLGEIDPEREEPAALRAPAVADQLQASVLCVPDDGRPARQVVKGPGGDVIAKDGEPGHLEAGS